MTFVVKFTFHLKSGKTFECFEELSAKEFLKAVEVVNVSMRDGREAVLRFEDCCIRLSECAVVEWEEINEQKTEKGE